MVIIFSISMKFSMEIMDIMDLLINLCSVSLYLDFILDLLFNVI